MPALNFLKVLALLGLLFMFGLLGVSACDGIELDYELPIADVPVIVLGTVVSVEDHPTETWAEVDIQVERYLKGQGDALIRVGNFDRGWDCLPLVTIGERAVFYIEGNHDTGYMAFLGSYHAVAEANPETINAIVGITEQSILPADAPLSLQLAYAWELYGNWFLGMSVAVSLLTYLGIRRFSKTARKKKKNDSL